MLHDELVGTNSPQARILCVKGCSLSRASLLRGYYFWLGNWDLGGHDDQFSLVVSSRSSLVPHLRVNFVHSFWSLSIGEDVMGSSVVTRSCSALGDEKLPITRVVPSLESISSVQFSCSVVSDSLRPHESQHARPPSPSPTAGLHPNPC